MSKQAEYVLRTVEERGIRFIRLWFTDVQGFLKSVSISPAELEVAFDEGMTFDGSSIDGYARVQEADMLAKPDPSTFAVLPWRSEQQVARMFCDIVTPNGEPFEGDPRYVLRRNLQRAADLGYSFYVGPELEYVRIRHGRSRRTSDIANPHGKCSKTLTKSASAGNRRGTRRGRRLGYPTAP